MDRGGCIQEFSQHPGEIEHLFNPLSFIEADGDPYVEVTPFGVVKMIPVRINLNLKGSTLESLLENKKRLHVSAFRTLVDEIRHEIQENPDLHDRLEARLAADAWYQCYPNKYSTHKLLSSQLKQCEMVLAKHEKIGRELYAKDDEFRELVTEMMDVKVMSLSKLKWYLEDQNQYIESIMDETVRYGHRGWIDYLERMLPRSDKGKEAALTLCRIKGLVKISADETNDLGEVRIISAAASGVSAKNLKLLIQADADVNAVTEAGLTALILATDCGNDDLVTVLVDAGASVNYAVPLGERFDAGWTALMKAATKGHARCEAGQRSILSFIKGLNCMCVCVPGASRYC